MVAAGSVSLASLESRGAGCALLTDGEKDVDELAVVDKGSCTDSRRWLVAMFSSSVIDSKESRGLGVEKNDPTTGWIAASGFNAPEAIR
jgi:hypothetical protein